MQKLIIQYSIGYALLGLINPFTFINDVSFIEGFLSFIILNSITALFLHLGFKYVTSIEKWLKDSIIYLLCVLISSSLLWLYWEGNFTTMYLTFVSSFILISAIVLLFRFIIYQGNATKKIAPLENNNSSFVIEEETKKLILKNSNDKIIIEILPEHVIYFESNDNYVIIHYRENDQAQKLMERISLKKIESQLKEFSSFLRVHKSFIVNQQFIQKVNGKSQSYRLKLNEVENEIPVSRSFDISEINR